MEGNVKFDNIIRCRGGRGEIHVRINGVFAGRILKTSTGDCYSWIPRLQTFEKDLGIELVEGKPFFVLSDETERQTLLRAKHYVKTGVLSA